MPMFIAFPLQRTAGKMPIHNENLVNDS
jgi:hypothetical protein